MNSELKNKYLSLMNEISDEYKKEANNLNNIRTIKLQQLKRIYSELLDIGFKIEKLDFRLDAGRQEICYHLEKIKFFFSVIDPYMSCYKIDSLIKTILETKN